MTALTLEDINRYITTIRVNFENAYNVQTKEERAMLYKTWYACLKEYPKEIVDKAVLNAIKHAKFAPRIGDIVEQIESLRKAYEKTDAELWESLTRVLPEVGRVMYFGTQRSWYNGRLIDPNEEVNRIYAGLDPLLQDYIGGVSGLVTLARAETLEYEKSRFLKTVPTLKARAQTRHETGDKLAALVEGMATLSIGGETMKLLK